MKVHHILAEVDYAVVRAGSGRNRVFNIIDPTTGAVVGKERIRGQADAKAKNLTAKSNVAAPKPSNTPALPVTTQPEAPKSVSKVKKAVKQIVKSPGKTMYNLFLSSPVGRVIGALISFEQLSTDLDAYANVYAANKCNINAPELNAAQLIITDNIAGGLVSFLTVGASTAASLAMLTRFFTVVPGFGWVLSIIGGASGIAISYLLGKLARDTGIIKGISDFIANTMLSKETLSSLSFPQCDGATESIDEAIEFRLQESVSQIKAASKDMVMNDPKLLAMLKAAKVTAS